MIKAPDLILRRDEEAERGDSEEHVFEFITRTPDPLAQKRVGRQKLS